MTFSEFGTIIHRHWWFVVAVPVVFAAVTFAYYWMQPPVYSASAQLTVTGEVAAVGGIAEGIAADQSTEGASAWSSTSATSKVITVTAQTGDSSASVRLANKVASLTNEKISELYADKVKVSVREASDAWNSSPPKKRLAAFAFGVGLVVAVLLLVVEDGVRKPLRNVREIEERAGIPTVGPIATADDYSLFVQGPFVAGDDSPEVVCAVPVDSAETAARFARDCRAAIGGTDASICGCDSIAADAGVAEKAKQADSVFVVVEAWKNRQAQLDDALARMQLAGVRPDVIVVIR